jgi:hypothetical protein
MTAYMFFLLWNRHILKLVDSWSIVLKAQSNRTWQRMTKIKKIHNFLAKRGKLSWKGKNMKVRYCQLYDSTYIFCFCFSIKYLIHSFIAYLVSAWQKVKFLLNITYIFLFVSYPQRECYQRKWSSCSRVMWRK